MGQLILDNISAGYRGQPIISELSLAVKEGEMVAILGPSGEGKTTILKTIAGLLPPLEGHIQINGLVVNSIAAEKRDVVLVFQKPLLFPFLNVRDNIGFGLRMQGIRGKQAAMKIAEMVELTGLQGLERRKVHQLSGGQQQRVALARGLVLRPSILLLDEPLSNLDADLRQQMRELIQHIRKQTGVTTLFVTHDQGEALMLSDRIALLLQGRLRQLGTPHELFYQPQDAEVASFFGCPNLLEGSIQNNTFSSGQIHIPVVSANRSQCTAVIRPEKIDIARGDRPDAITGTVTSISFEGVYTRLGIETASCELTIFSSSNQYTIGESVYLFIPSSAVHIIS